MSSCMNYTYQSFKFRNRQGARPFYDLLASIAAEVLGGWAIEKFGRLKLNGRLLSYSPLSRWSSWRACCSV